MTTAPIEGFVAPGFEPVREQFERNFSERGEVGGAVAVYRAGQPVVDLWGGYRDHVQKDPWQQDTLVMVFSTTKGLAALTVAHAVSAGLLSYDEPVASYWPGFGKAGKAGITLRQLLGHEAGLAVLDDPPVPAEVLADSARLRPLLEGQAPLWEPGSAHGYHAVTVGLYLSELIRQVDPAGRSLGQYFAEEIAGPLDLEFYFGTPASVPDDRVAGLKTYSPLGLMKRRKQMERAFLKARMRRGSLTQRVMTFPKVKTVDAMMKPPYRSIEMAAANGIGQVRSIAHAFGVFAAGGKELGISAKTITMLEADAPGGTPDEDLVLKAPASFSLGMWKPGSYWQFGSDGRAYATPGAGGSIGLADPATKVGFAYAPNFIGMAFRGDPRQQALLDTALACARASC